MNDLFSGFQSSGPSVDALSHPPVATEAARPGNRGNAWERARAAEIIDRVPARLLIELVGRPLAEKIADALRFPVSQLLEN
jgi:hypothetical protein